MSAQVTLRPVRPSDLDAFFEEQRDPEAVSMAAVASRDRESFDAHWARILPEPGNLLYSIEADGELAGNVVSWSADGERKVGYWIAKACWGRGIATAALREFLARHPERPLFAYVARHNVGSKRVLEKCGFRVIESGVIAELSGDAVEEYRLRLD